MFASSQTNPGTIRPFRLETTQAELQDLKQRLSKTRWPDELPGAGWNYGAPLSFVKDMAAYWEHSFDWTKQEQRLNSYPQFMTTIDGANIHFFHIRSSEPGAVPLMLIHGWPSSPVEFLKLVGPLTDPTSYGGDAADAFHLVIPSLPGFGLSGPTTDTGWSPFRAAQALDALMTLLGYEQYGPTAEELSHPDQIVVWYVDGQGQATPIPNGRYDAATGTVVFHTTHFSTYAVAYASTAFTDLQNVPWAKPAIDAMAARGVIHGMSESRFSPEALIKRADFVALLVRALELQGTGSPKTAFSDVDPIAYNRSELNTANELGIAVGLPDRTFKPDSPITRQEMMVLTARALAAAGKTVGGSGSLSAYADAASIASYAKDSAAALVKAGIVTGSNGKIAPQGPLTRAEAAVILYRIWKL
uniref:Predicted protein n=1 Tax=Physcomitrium patens TaxID=3218 RepID=A9U721_PHYPA